MKVMTRPAGIRLLPRAIIDAHAGADAILSEARSEAQGVRDEARREGEQQARADASAWMARAAIAAAKRESELESHIAELAIDVARTILGREAASGPEVLRDVVRRALGHFRRARQVILQVHPDDLEFARSHHRTWIPAGCDPDVIEIDAADGIERGGVVVHTDIGKLDARLETQLGAIARALAGQ
jgi:type III secretion protein L